MKTIPHHQFKSVYLFLLSILISVINLTSCSSSQPIKSSITQSVYERVIQSGKIRAAYMNYSPYCMKDPITHKMSGIGPEALELIAKKLGLEVIYTEEVGWGNLVEGLETNRYDTVAIPLWTNANRAKVAWFSKPLCFNPCYVYVRNKDNRFRNHLEKINSPDVTISTIDGESGDVIAQADFPNAKRLSLPQMTDYSQLLLNVISKKADVAIGEPGFVSRFMKQNPGSLQIVDSNKPIRVFPDTWILKRGEADFKTMIDTVLDEIINSGEMDRIIHKYENNSLAVLSVAKPYQFK